MLRTERRDFPLQGNLDGRRIDIVGGLAAIHVINGVQCRVVALTLTHQLQRAVGNDLVGVHVGAGPGSALDGVHHKLVIQEAIHDFQGSLLDGRGFFWIEQAQAFVCTCCGVFHGPQAPDEGTQGADGSSADGEIVHRP
ncbi:hypothetical protein D3C73_1380270 [compost metagenome]